MGILHSSTRRPAPLKPEDYDHEIILIDRTLTPESQAPTDRLSSPASPATSRHDSNVPLNPKRSLRGQIARRKYGKYRDHRAEGPTESDNTDDEQPGVIGPGGETSDGDGGERGRLRTAGSVNPRIQEEQESGIDIRYENERGAFVCGCLPLFSRRALGNLDPSPWTNSAQKTSATDTTNAQCPDPSWEWVWKDWKINLTDEVDENGWEYSFMFSKHFSWHGPSWWNSYVRRRAWIRKRAKKPISQNVDAAHMLTDEYFTVHPAMQRSRSVASTMRESICNRHSISQLANQKTDNESVLEDISDIPTLMTHLKAARIDREKMEVVENFIENGGDELYYLHERMHEIMSTFIFQASRRLLLAHLIQTFTEVKEKQKQKADGDPDSDPAVLRRLDNLEMAVKQADEEVRRLEFWSDVKDMAEKGETQGAVDESQGWDKTWTGLDNSAPKDVISEENLPGKANRPADREGNRTAIESSLGKGKGAADEDDGTTAPSAKGKGKKKTQEYR